MDEELRYVSLKRNCGSRLNLEQHQISTKDPKIVTVRSLLEPNFVENLLQSLVPQTPPSWPATFQELLAWETRIEGCFEECLTKLGTSKTNLIRSVSGDGIAQELDLLATELRECQRRIRLTGLWPELLDEFSSLLASYQDKVKLRSQYDFNSYTQALTSLLQQLREISNLFVQSVESYPPGSHTSVSPYVKTQIHNPSSLQDLVNLKATEIFPDFSKYSKFFQQSVCKLMLLAYQRYFLNGDHPRFSYNKSANIFIASFSGYVRLYRIQSGRALLLRSYMLLMNIDLDYDIYPNSLLILEGGHQKTTLTNLFNKKIVQTKLFPGKIIKAARYVMSEQSYCLLTRTEVIIGKVLKDGKLGTINRTVNNLITPNSHLHSVQLKGTVLIFRERIFDLDFQPIDSTKIIELKEEDPNRMMTRTEMIEGPFQLPLQELYIHPVIRVLYIMSMDDGQIKTVFQHY